MFRGLIISAFLNLVFQTNAFAAPRVDKPTAGKPMKAPTPAKITKAKPSKGGTPTTVINMPLKKKQEMLTAEKRYNTKTNNVNFDASIIEGEAIRPVVSSVSGQKADQEFDLIPIRKRWHEEMIDSSTEL